MKQPRILTVQDISCVGQCSLTVALPIISACGVETCVLPSAVLSTHTGGFTGYTFRDLTDDIPGILAHWKKEGILFDAVYTGYLGSARQIDLVEEIFSTMLTEGGLKIVDPAMADGGKLYPGFDMAFAERMHGLCAHADILLPNITEACLLTGTEYRETYDEVYINALSDRLLSLGVGTVVQTGVGNRPGKTGVYVRGKSGTYYYEHEKMENGCHGTGDVYASAFAGALMNGFSVNDAARIAADYTLLCIRRTAGDPSHWYGVRFEPAIPDLVRMLGK